MKFHSPLTYLIIFLFLSLLFSNLAISKEQQFVLLAKSFQQGSLSFTNIGSDFSDTVLFEGKYYWPLGPFPAILIFPFLYISQHFYQGYLSFPLSILNFALLYKLGTYFKLDHKRSILLSIFFIFGSVYTGVAAIPGSWYFAQTLATTLLLLALSEFYFKKGYLLTGVFIALATATKLTLALSIIFFILLLYKENNPFKKIAKLTIPLIGMLLLLGLYNNARFNNPFESGYSLQIIPEEPLARRVEGLFSIYHIPENLFYMLLKGPEPLLKDQSHQLKFPYITFDSYGLSVFFLSPILFLIARADFRKRIIRASSLTAFVLLIPILTYYGIGQKQVGYRYALDLFPFIYLILADAVKQFNYKIMLVLIFWGVFFTMYFTFLYIGGLEV